MDVNREARLEAAFRDVTTDDVAECSAGTHHVYQLARNVLDARPERGVCDHCGQLAPCTERRIAAALVALVQAWLPTADEVRGILR